jgi:predicted nucleic acid-binding protein
VADYFLDTSALVKRYAADEIGHAWVEALCLPASGHSLIISEAAFVEVVASICRMARSVPPRLDVSERDRLIALVRNHDAARDYVVIPVARLRFDQAADLCGRRPLRAYDAVQLACALQARDDASNLGLAPPTFVCADAALLAVAAAEGLPVDNPNDHP